MDDYGQQRGARRPGSYLVSDSAGARRGIRTPDRLIKRLQLAPPAFTEQPAYRDQKPAVLVGIRALERWIDGSS
jgi:hypothetical protein